MPADSKPETKPPRDEQQQAIATLKLSESRRHLAEVRRRERLRRQARSYPGRRWASPVFYVLAVWATSKLVEFPYLIVPAAVLAIVCALVQVHVSGINQRLDAIVELGEADDGNTKAQRSSPKEATNCEVLNRSHRGAMP